MKRWGLFVFAGLWLAFSSPVWALDLNEGMHGMPWAGDISRFGNLTKVRESDPVAYYVNSATLFQVANQPVPAVIYGFYKGRFFAVYIKLRSPDQLSTTKRHYSKKYGEPKVTVSESSSQTVYRWKTGDVKIKLKQKASTGEIKMAIYYEPLSRQVNEQRLDRFPVEGDHQMILKKMKTPIPVPLLEE